MNSGHATRSTEHRDALNRRQLLGVVGAAAGTAVWVCEGKAAAVQELRSGKCFVRVAAVSYSMPFHDHRSGVNLQALREMTGQVAKERQDFICYPGDYLARSVKLRNERLDVAHG